MAKGQLRVHPQRLLKNVSISARARNLEKKDFEIMPGKLKKQKKKNRKELREKRGRRSQLDFANLTKFIFYSISGGGKLSC